MKIPVSVVIPVKNEEKNLAKCLHLLTDFDEVLVIDSNSTDNTCKIAEQYDAKVHQFFWDGKFPKKRNWVLRNINLKNDWVLFLDADEYITDAFKTEIRKAILDTNCNGYWVTFVNCFMGKQLRHGDPFKKLPLIRKGTGEYEKIEEDSWSYLDMEVHEHPIISGKVGQLKSHILHNDYKGLEHYINRHNAYSSWEANRYIQLKKKGFAKLNKRQKAKYKLIELGLMPLAYFLGSYFFKLGFLDGNAGFYFALYKANYFFQIQTKIKEIQS